MKEVVMNNPNEARTMLLQNPQLAYALLQAQVRTRIVNPDTAVKMLHPLRDIKPEPFDQSSVQAEAPIMPQTGYERHQQQPSHYPATHGHVYTPQPDNGSVPRGVRSAPMAPQPPQMPSAAASSRMSTPPTKPNNVSASQP